MYILYCNKYYDFSVPVTQEIKINQELWDMTVMQEKGGANIMISVNRALEEKLPTTSLTAL